MASRSKRAVSSASVSSAAGFVSGSRVASAADPSVSVMLRNTVPSVAAPSRRSGRRTRRNGASTANVGTMYPLLSILEVTTDDFLLPRTPAQLIETTAAAADVFPVMFGDPYAVPVARAATPAIAALVAA